MSLNDRSGRLNAILNENLNRARTDASSSRPVRRVRRCTRAGIGQPAPWTTAAATTPSTFNRAPGGATDGDIAQQLLRARPPGPVRLAHARAPVARSSTPRSNSLRPHQRQPPTTALNTLDRNLNAAAPFDALNGCQDRHRLAHCAHSAISWAFERSHSSLKGAAGVDPNHTTATRS